MAAQPAAVLVPYRDADGKQICTTLADGVRLAWRNMVDNTFLTDGTTGIYLTSCKSFSVENGVALVESSANAGFFQLSCVYKSDKKYISMVDLMHSQENTKQISSAIVFDWYASSQYYTLYYNPGERKRINFLCNTIGDNVRVQVNTIGSGRYEGAKVYFYGAYVHDLEETFSNHPSLMPTTADAFQSMFWSENSEDLGYTPYTAEPTEVVVKDGKLWIQGGG